MTRIGKGQVLRTVALALSMGLIWATAACGAPQGQEPTKAQPPATRPSGNVALFAPSDGITISQHTPLNKWAKLLPEVTNALRDEGFGKGSITTKTSDSLDTQSREVQDYVVDGLTQAGAKGKKDSAAKAKETTLVIAPVIEASDATRQYGDYTRSDYPISKTDNDHGDKDQADGQRRDGAGTNGGDPADKGGKDSQDSQDAALRRLVSSLNLAKEAGAHVILLSNPLDGFNPDLFVNMSTPEEIGAVQAKEMVNKLALDKASSKNPKSIELLLPYTLSQSDGQVGRGTDGKGSSDSGEGSQADAQGQEPAELEDAFASRAFAGVWQVLQPYFKAGKAYSPSNCLTAESKTEDWTNCALDADKSSKIREQLDKRLAMTSKADAHTRIDGIICMNDYVVSGVIEELDALGYVGSSADVNPTITLPDLVGSITGKHDLTRHAVPDPQSPDDQGTEDQSAGGNSDRHAANQSGDQAAKWPVLVGYGAYLDTIAQIVNGKEWMTALEDRQAMSAGIAVASKALNQGKDVHQLAGMESTSMNGGQVPMLHKPLLAVSASNLKDILIDPGYISLADAGL
ncbi:hypothetical protein CRD60_02225 [Bifidobacterium aemilianum]|uniref:Periplasmic binding protein domain-containing protein n=1 Tax=Bifidobacterium aemilianum TaxID=2493120 RepID=A0A366K8F2_9BIFI|nr:hypothetical protein [Bifidobacterium aemilianum]RBP98015.1 hypothetical protein CRD60_02225 [Bifidobacterium aemilianum]